LEASVHTPPAREHVMPRAVYPLYKAYQAPLGEPVSAGPLEQPGPGPGPGWTRRGVLVAIAVAVGAGVLIGGFVAMVSSLQPSQSNAPAPALASPTPVAETPADAAPDLIASAADTTGSRKSAAEQELALRDAFDQGLSLEGLTHLIPIAEADGVEGSATEREITKELLLKYMLRELGKENIPTTGEGASAFLTMRLTTIVVDSAIVWSSQLEVSQPAVLRNNNRVMLVATWSRGHLGRGSIQKLSGLRTGWDETVSQLSTDWRRTHDKQTAPVPKPVPARAGARSRSSASSRPGCDPPPPARRPVPETARRRGEPTPAPLKPNDGNWELKS